MVIALRGWFDIAEVATTAINELFADRIAPIVASIDPDPFFDFTQERPLVELDEDEIRQIRWPVNEFRFARFPGAPHDLVVLAGVEPHLRYATFADSVLEVAKLSKCEVVVTVGAVADTIPHTRPPLVVGSTTNASLLTALGLSPPQIPGHHRSRRRAAGATRPSRHPGGVAAGRRAALPRQRPASAVVDRAAATPPPRARRAGAHGSPGAEAARAGVLHDEAVAEDEQASAYVAMLEREYDQRAEEAIPSGDDLPPSSNGSCAISATTRAERFSTFRRQIPILTETRFAVTYNRMVVDHIDRAQQRDLVFHALADATDVIVRSVLDTEQSVSGLARRYPMSFAAVHKHAAVLERAGLVTKRRHGREQLVRGRIESARHAYDVFEELEAVWRGRIDRFDQILSEPDEQGSKQ